MPKDDPRDLIEWLGFARTPAWAKSRLLGGLIGVALAVFLLFLLTAAVILIVASLSAAAGAPPGATLGAGGLIVALLGAPFLIWNTIIKQRSLGFQKEGHITDRISKAVEQLGAEKTVKRPLPDADGNPRVDGEGKPMVAEQTVPNIEVRIGGILSLERIAQDSCAYDHGRDHVRVMEILCAYVRENAPAREAKDSLRYRYERASENTRDEPGLSEEQFIKLNNLYEFDFHESVSVAAQSQWTKSLTAPREDIAQAMKVIGRRDAAQRRIEARWGKDAKPDAEWAFDTACPILPDKFEDATMREAELESYWARLLEWRKQIGDYAGYQLDLRNANLQNADLSNAILSGARLNCARLEGAILRQARMEGAILRRARMEGSNLSQARMEGADLREARIEGADLSQARMEGANLREARMEATYFWNAQLEGADLSQARMEGADLGMAQLEWAVFKEAQMEGANLCGALLRRAFFFKANLEGANLSSAKLSGAVFREAQLDRITLKRTNLQGAFFSGATIKNADFHQAILTDIDLSDALMQGTNFSEALMQGANLSGSNLEGANLSEARLDGANLRNTCLRMAILRGTNLEGANLSNAGFEGSDFYAARMDKYTILDGAVLNAASVRSADWSSVALSLDQISSMFGDASAYLPERAVPGGKGWPKHWPSFEVGVSRFDREWRKWQADPAAYTPPPPPA